MKFKSLNEKFLAIFGGKWILSSCEKMSPAVISREGDADPLVAHL